MVSVLLILFPCSLTSIRVFPEIIAAGLWSLPLYLLFLVIVLFAIFSFNRDQQSIPYRNKSRVIFIFRGNHWGWLLPSLGCCWLLTSVTTCFCEKHMSCFIWTFWLMGGKRGCSHLRRNMFFNFHHFFKHGWHCSQSHQRSKSQRQKSEHIEHILSRFLRLKGCPNLGSAGGTNSGMLPW